MRLGTGWALRAPRRTMVSSILCPVCYARRVPVRSLFGCDSIRITCSAACHAVWWLRLVALMARCPNVANQARLLAYYARREVIPDMVMHAVLGLGP